MFTPEILFQLKSILSVLDKTKHSPFSWDTRNNFIIPTTSKFTIVYAKLFFTHYILYFIYTVAQLYISYQTASGNATTTFWLVFMCTGHILCGEIFSSVFAKRKDLACFFRDSMKLDEELTSMLPNYLQSKLFRNFNTFKFPELYKSPCKIKRSEQMLKFVITGSVASAVLLEICAIGLYALRGSGPFFVYHIYPDKNNFFAYVVFFLMDAYMKAVNAV